MSKGFGLAVALALAAGLLQPTAASACYVCKLESGDLDCTLIIGETGGSECIINCKSNGLCFCRTLGLCYGTNGCDGSPCPTIHNQDPGLAFGPSEKEPVWLTRELYERVQAADPEAAILLSSLARDPDALSVGLRDRIPFQAGESNGILTAPSGRKDKPLAYRYKALVTPMNGGVSIHIEVFGHPRLHDLDAQVWNDLSGTYVELGDGAGTSRRVEL